MQQLNSSNRFLSLDVYRGIIMLYLTTELIDIPSLAEKFPESGFWQFIYHHTTHTPWVGFTAWDMIQPSFMFMVGTSLCFSVANRLAKGQTKQQMWIHALKRSFILIILGIFLRSLHKNQTYYTFEDVITQIGLGYPFLFALSFTRIRTQVITAFVILVAYWALFAFWPLVPEGYDYSQYKLPDKLELLSGFAAHWNIHTNPANYFDHWFLNLFPVEKTFVYNYGGYQTLNFIPSLATMIFGLVTGEILRSSKQPSNKIGILLRGGSIGILTGLLLQYTGICPLVKPIWTPGWCLFSSGIVIILLTATYWWVDVRGHQKRIRPITVVGANPMAMYIMQWTFAHFVIDNLNIHLGRYLARLPFYEMIGHQVLTGFLAFLILWWVCSWLYKKKLFVRI